MKYKAGLLSLLFIIIFISGCGAGRTDELAVGTTGQMARYTQIDGEGILKDLKSIYGTKSDAAWGRQCVSAWGR